MINVTTHPIESEKTIKPFPKLMISVRLGFVILATDKKVPPGKIEGTKPHYVGTVIHGKGYWPIGYYSDGWDGDGFIDYTLPITLENE